MLRHRTRSSQAPRTPLELQNVLLLNFNGNRACSVQELRNSCQSLLSHVGSTNAHAARRQHDRLSKRTSVAPRFRSLQHEVDIDQLVNVPHSPNVREVTENDHSSYQFFVHKLQRNRARKLWPIPCAAIFVASRKDTSGRCDHDSNHPFNPVVATRPAPLPTRRKVWEPMFGITTGHRRPGTFLNLETSVVDLIPSLSECREPLQISATHVTPGGAIHIRHCCTEMRSRYTENSNAHLVELEKTRFSATKVRLRRSNPRTTQLLRNAGTMTSSYASKSRTKVEARSPLTRQCAPPYVPDSLRQTPHTWRTESVFG